MADPLRELQSTSASLKRYWSLITKITAPRYCCVSGLSEHVIRDSPALSATGTASQWQTSTTWTVGCIRIHLHFHCIANKYSYLMIPQDAVGRLYSAQTSGANVCQYIMHNLLPLSLLWERRGLPRTTTYNMRSGTTTKTCPHWRRVRYCGYKHNGTGP